MTTTVRTRPNFTAASPDRRAQELLEAASRDLYDAECALHAARQSQVDAWIAAASERLHEAITRYLFADATCSAERPGRHPDERY